MFVAHVILILEASSEIIGTNQVRVCQVHSSLYVQIET